MAAVSQASRPNNRWDWVHAMGVGVTEAIIMALDRATQEMQVAPGNKSRVTGVLMELGMAMSGAGSTQEQIYAVLKGMKQYHGVNHLKTTGLAKAACAPHTKARPLADFFSPQQPAQGVSTVAGSSAGGHANAAVQVPGVMQIGAPTDITETAGSAGQVGPTGIDEGK